MKQFILCVATLLVSVELYADTSEEMYCSRNAVCLSQETQRDNAIVKFFASNWRGFPVTITLRMNELTNMESNVPLPHTETLEPYQTKHLATLSRTDAASPWKWNSEYNWRPGPREGEHSGYIYSLPYAEGQAFKVTKGFNEPESHLGNNKYSIDWAMAEGTPIYAARGGVVGDVIDNFSENGGIEFADKGNFVCVIHDDGTLGYYYHIKQYGSNVKVGQKVEEGSLIAWSGNTGYSSGPHLHFAVSRVIDGYTSRSVPIKFKNGTGEWFVPKTGRVYRNGKDNQSEQEETRALAPKSIKDIQFFGHVCVSHDTSQRDCRP